MQSEARVSSQPASSSLKPSWLGWPPLIVLPLIVLILSPHFQAWVFMWLLAGAIFAGLKWITWWNARTVGQELWRSFAYLVLWPGMDAAAFLDSTQRAKKSRIGEWLWAAAKTGIGIGLVWLIARQFAVPLIQGWICLLGLVLLLHFGSFHLIALFWQSLGVCAQPIMAAPILSRSLSEFWGKRWNRGFRQLAFDLIFQPLHMSIGAGAAGLSVFLVSGLIHDLVISVPAHGGYGLPTGYFLLQGLGVSLERSSPGRRLGLQRGISGWLYMFVFTAGPAFWLFHPPFVMRVILPFMRAIGAL